MWCWWLAGWQKVVTNQKRKHGVKIYSVPAINRAVCLIAERLLRGSSLSKTTFTILALYFAVTAPCPTLLEAEPCVPWAGAAVPVWGQQSSRTGTLGDKCHQHRAGLKHKSRKDHFPQPLSSSLPQEKNSGRSPWDVSISDQEYQGHTSSLQTRKSLCWSSPEAGRIFKTLEYFKALFSWSFFLWHFPQCLLLSVRGSRCDPAWPSPPPCTWQNAFSPKCAVLLNGKRI